MPENEEEEEQEEQGEHEEDEECAQAGEACSPMTKRPQTRGQARGWQELGVGPGGTISLQTDRDGVPTVMPVTSGMPFCSGPTSPRSFVRWLPIT